MSHVLPPNFFEAEEAAAKFEQQLPIVCWTPLKEPPFDISFFLCCRYRMNAYRFFCEIVSRWLIPGKRINTHLQFASDFCLPEWGGQRYIAGEVLLHIEQPRDFEILQKNLPIIESEIRLGVESLYHASRILEIKGLTSDEKTALIQENIVSLIEHRPQDFDYDIISEMQHFLVLCGEEFKAARHFRHMSKIICVHYLFRKALKHSLEAFPERRYISVKLVRAKVDGKSSVLGIALGISFIRNNEILETSHILSAVKALIPDVKEVFGSFFKNQSRSDMTCTLYLEIEKERGGSISLEEERRLKRELPSELKNHIQQGIHPIFMPQNEEEILRHILTLSAQLTFVRDLPQTMILFNQQTNDCLEFLVIVLRVVTPEIKPIAASFESKSTSLEYIHDRAKIVGRLRKKHKKEASVFRLKIRKFPFLRSDHSIDLYRARQEVVKELTRVLGEFRDFNGGTISKETELFDKLRKGLGNLAKEQALHLENFFFSLSPPVMRSILPPEPIKDIFIILMEAERDGLSDGQPFQIHIHEKGEYFHLVILAKEASFFELLAPLIEDLKTPSFQLTSFFLPKAEMPSSFGLICKGAQEEILHLKFLVERSMTDWGQKFMHFV